MQLSGRLRVKEQERCLEAEGVDFIVSSGGYR